MVIHGKLLTPLMETFFEQFATSPLQISHAVETLLLVALFKDGHSESFFVWSKHCRKSVANHPRPRHPNCGRLAKSKQDGKCRLHEVTTNLSKKSMTKNEKNASGQNNPGSIDSGPHLGKDRAPRPHHPLRAWPRSSCAGCCCTFYSNFQPQLLVV